MNWERVRLGDIVNIRTGKLDANAAVENGEFPFFTCAKEISRIDNYAFDGECVLVAGNGDLNVKYYNGKFNAYQRTYVIQTSNETLDIKYLYYFLEEYLEKLRIKSIGGVIKYIKLENLQEPKIPLPPLSVQNEIVEKLDKAAAIREKSKALLAHYDALSESLFIELFGDPISNEKGWEKKNCDDLFYINLGKMLSAKNYKGDSLKPYLRNINVLWGEISLKDIKEMDFYEKEFEKYRLKKGDILVCEGGEVGRTAIFNLEEEYFIQNAIHRVRIKQPNILSQYFLYLMKYGVPNGMLEGLVNGVGIKHFTLEKFKTLEIPLPPLSLQIKFAEMVENIEEQKARAKAEIEQSEAVFQALLQESFG